jgi:ribonuclease G
MQEGAPDELDLAVAPPPPEPVAPIASEQSGGDESTPAKRRRGNRGGRGRKRPADGTATATAVAEPEQKTAAKGAERRPRVEKPKPERKAREERKPPRRRQAPKRAPLPAAKRELLVSVDVGEQRVAVLEDDRVAEVYLERPEKRSIAGNIYKGVVDNVLPGMEAAFVEIGLEKNGFLYVDEIVAPELEGKARHGKRIQDLISRGQEILVQAVKDPMKTKGARLTTEISLPGRFVVFVPYGEGLGVSRRLEDDERQRLKDILKALPLPEGGVIVRTAAEGASAEDIERDLVFLQRLWKTIQERAKAAPAPTLVYQEAELPLRVVRDLFTGDFERAVIDHERTMKRVVGYLKKTSPHMVERVVRYKEKTPLMEQFGVEQEIRSTLSRRVDLPSGGYLVFDYAEAFTVIDVNTGRFVGGRGKNSNARLEDTITKNNLEAVKEVVRQLRLRDIGGIIVIDFIDMASPKNRAVVEEALKQELERDRTKTYVVEISPLGLVEMTRQNVTDGPREILTKKCPTCAGDGIVVSDGTAAVDVERRLRALASGSRCQAFRVEMNAKVASLVVGAGAERLTEIEAVAKKRFVIEGRPDVHSDHFAVLAEGSVDELVPAPPLAEGAEIELKLVEIGRYDASAGVGRHDGHAVVVAGAASHVGKKVKAKIGRAVDGAIYATLADAPKLEAPITAEAEAEKPTRKPPARKAAAAAAAEESAVVEADEALEEEAEAVEAEGEVADEGEEPKPKKRTRRGSRGGRGRKKPAGEGEDEGEGAAAEPDGAVEAAAEGEIAVEADAPSEPEPEPGPEPEPAQEPAPAAPRIHVPDPELGRDEEDESEDGPQPDSPPKKRTRRGSRGGRNRRKRTTAGPNGDGDAVGEGEEAAPEEQISSNGAGAEEPSVTADTEFR